MRGIDHLVLAAADLEAARQRYGDLGFTLTPPGRHPFGTANSLVQLDGAFLELLSIAEPAAIPPHARRRFSFAAFNRDYLDAGEGFSMLVLDSRDARADADAFRQAGLATYEPFDFSRTAELPSGEEVKVGFSLAFTGHPDIDSAAFFTCQQHAPEHFWRPEYQNHENTAHTVQEVCLVADRPLQFAEFLQAFAGSDEVVASDSAVEVATARGHLVVLTCDAFAERYGTPAPESHPLPALAGYTVGVSDLPAARSIVARAGVATAEGDGRLSVLPEDAFGTVLAFAGA
ncbi:MAG TPA: VOC family protein [Aestuariivirgaceae bacterium]|nr:VOC family protein [Aestuariivirgaceae bacterium]